MPKNFAQWLSAALIAGSLGLGGMAVANAEDTITITFDLNGHGDAIAAISCPSGQTCNLPTATARDFVFIDWFMDAAGLTPLTSQWAEGGGFDDDTTLYAQWIAGYTVDWDYGGHGSGPAFTTVQPASRVSQPAMTVETGWIFQGWYSDSTTTTAWSFSTSVTAAMTLYAKWSAETPTSPTPTTPTPTPTPSQTTTPPPVSASPSPSSSPSQPAQSTSASASATASGTPPQPTAPAASATPSRPATTQPPTATPKTRPTVKVKLAATRLKPGQRAKLTVQVTVSGLTKPTGRIKVNWGQRSTTKTLKAGAKGKLIVRSPKLAKGRYQIAAVYNPTGQAAVIAQAGQSKTTKLRVK